MKRLRFALAFLTIVPIGRLGTVREQDIAGSFVWFPLVGLGIGGILAGTHRVVTMWLPPLAVGACVLLLWILVTGALHLDGLGDTCDSLYAGRTPAERLRIMKDPHVGAMAVVAISGLLIAKFALVSSAIPPRLWQALVLAPCLGRYAMVLLGTLLPYARREQGLGASFVQHAHPGHLFGASVIAGAACWWVLGPAAWGVLAMVLAGTGLLGWIFVRSFGGVTGDTLGATGELIEAVVLLGC